MEQPFVSTRSRAELERELKLAKAIVANQTTAKPNETFEAGYIAALSYIGISDLASHEFMSIEKLYTTLNMQDKARLEADPPTCDTITEKQHSLASSNCHLDLEFPCEPLLNKTTIGKFCSLDEAIERKKRFVEVLQQLDD